MMSNYVDRKPHKSRGVYKSQPLSDIFGNDFNILKHRRELLGYDPEEYANHIGYNVRTIQRIERMKLDKESPDISLKSLLKYLDGLGLELVVRRKT